MWDKVLNPLDLLPTLPLADGIEAFINWLRFLIRDATRAFSEAIGDRGLMGEANDLLIDIPPFILIIIVALIAWKASGRGVALFTFLGLSLIYNMGYWVHSIETVTLIVLSVAISVVIGVPVGILSARSDTVHKVVWPILDFMQTMPAFVYLIPAVFFFGLGPVAAMVATIIFSMPPVVRLTGLGIRQVSVEVVEAASAFGTTEWQKLIKVQMPLAKATIMAGINQCIMLALSMVVIAAMIGAGGLGAQVLRGIQRLDIGGGFASGLCIVILAIILDRITQSPSPSTGGE